MAIRSYVETSFCQAAVLVVLGGLSAVIVNGLRPAGLPWIGDWLPAVVTSIQLNDYDIVSREKIRSLKETDSLFFIDPRDTQVALSFSLPGSLNVPPDEVPAMLPEIRALADAGMEIVIFCDGAYCSRGSELARVLTENDFRKFRLFREERTGNPNGS